jgi:hypothetical protein
VSCSQSRRVSHLPRPGGPDVAVRRRPVSYRPLWNSQRTTMIYENAARSGIPGAASRHAGCVLTCATCPAPPSRPRACPGDRAALAAAVAGSATGSRSLPFTN